MKNHVRAEPSSSTRGPPLAPQPPWPECGTEREPQIAGPNNLMLEIIEEDVRATAALPMSLLEVHVASPHEPKNKYTKLLEVWKRVWNLRRTRIPQVGMMKMNDNRSLIVLKSLVDSKLNQRPMLSHSKHRTTDAVEQKNNVKRSSLGSMKGARQQSFVKLKLTYKRNWQAWDEKTMGALSLLHQITDQDVYTTLALPMGLLEVNVASAYEPKINTLDSLNYRGEGGIWEEQGYQK
ncbi:hypothetical protein Cgig2_002766 [Carnegiea gigantea]|uniref:Uncharacterized protein n=1 Tax=Carnegiea gigantea TaxID=171969 RepID=A0A9Q1GYD7_9CARY|nr:hypothetical protein Cgig2_002766 [Carnegiea gigantea]